MINSYEIKTREELEAIFAKILEDNKINDFITDMGNGIFRVDSGGGNVLYTSKVGAQQFEDALTERLLNYNDDVTTKSTD